LLFGEVRRRVLEDFENRHVEGYKFTPKPVPIPLLSTVAPCH
jgi:hypothetical protein